MNARAFSAMTIIAAPGGALGMHVSLLLYAIRRMAASVVNLSLTLAVRISSYERSSAKSPFRQVNASLSPLQPLIIGR